MPPLPICCLLYHFGANVDTLSFHPWIFLCQSLKNKNLYGKKTFKIITTMLLSPWVVLTCSQVWAATLGGLLGLWGQNQGCPSHCRHLPESCWMSAFWVRTWSKQGDGRQEELNSSAKEGARFYWQKGIFFFSFCFCSPKPGAWHSGEGTNQIVACMLENIYVTYQAGSILSRLPRAAW